MYVSAILKLWSSWFQSNIQSTFLLSLRKERNVRIVTMLAATEMIFVSMVEHAKRSVKPTTEGLDANAGQATQGGFATEVRVIG